MDPNAALEEIRALVSRIGTPASEPASADALRLVELVEGLDTWITCGGFPPQSWASHDVREVR